ncbi:MAG: hypothetical protein ACOH2N_20940 [Devosia sp.]
MTSYGLIREIGIERLAVEISKTIQQPQRSLCDDAPIRMGNIFPVCYIIRVSPETAYRPDRQQLTTNDGVDRATF